MDCTVHKLSTCAEIYLRSSLTPLLNQMKIPRGNSIISTIQIYAYTMFTHLITMQEGSVLCLDLPFDYPARNVNSGEMGWLMGLLDVLSA